MRAHRSAQIRRRTPLRRAPAALALAACGLILAAGCGEPDYTPITSIPVGISYPSGDRAGNLAGEMGLDEGETNTARIVSEAFEGVARVSCSEQHVGHDGIFRLRFTAPPTAERESGLDLDLLVPGTHGSGTYDAALTYARTDRDRGLLVSHGTGVVELELTEPRAAQYAASGSFEASWVGDAGGGEARGTFHRCYFLK